MKIRFILNPVSGRNSRTVRLLPLLRDFIRERNLDAELHVTEGPGHAVELARAAVQSGCQLVVAIGGDGTLNEVAQALIHTPAALALVPCGSGNGLALHLGIPLAPPPAWSTPMAKRTKPPPSSRFACTRKAFASSCPPTRAPPRCSRQKRAPPSPRNPHEKTQCPYRYSLRRPPRYR